MGLLQSDENRYKAFKNRRLGNMTMSQNFATKRPRYPAYKDSGIEWLGEIPAHWEVKRLKYIFYVINGSTPKSGISEYWDGNIAWVTPEDLGQLKGDTLFSTARQITQAGYLSCGTKLVPLGSLVLSTRAPIGHLAITGVELCSNQGCKCLVFRNLNNIRYFYYLLTSARMELKSRGLGTTFQELAKGKLEAVVLPIPPLEEQKAIALFLDREITLIDNFIACKQRLIELLKEKRTALISHVVTKGLNPNVAYKDSGVEWLGEIPAHWEVKRLKYIARLFYGDSLSNDNRIDGNVYVYGSNGVIGTHNVANTLAPCIIVGRKGSYGKVTFSNSPVFAIDTTYFIDKKTAQTNFDFKWLFYTLPLLQLDKMSQDTGVPGLNREFAHNQLLIFPPLEEQKAIASYLDREITLIDTLITKTTTSIEYFKEYRTALISAAVTGKIDVRR